MSKYFAAIFVLGLCSFALAQDAVTEEQQRVLQQLRDRKKLRPADVEAQDAEADLKQRILEKVRAKLSADRSALLKRIEKIIDEELSKGGPAAKTPAPAQGDPSVKDLERKMRQLEEQKETLAVEMAKAKRLAADEPLREEAKKSGPHDAQEAKEMFDNALELHEKDKNYREAIKLFKRVYYNSNLYPKTTFAAISAYNVACGYALAGNKEEALDWLEHSVKSGYNDFDHLREDSDLDGLRNEKRYKKLLTDR